MQAFHGKGLPAKEKSDYATGGGGGEGRRNVVERNAGATAEGMRRV